MKKYVCECIGTAVLVLFGCGSAAIAGATLGTLGIALAFGLSIIAMYYIIGNVSGCHINPAVSLAMLITKKMDVKDFVCYVIAQILGAITGIGILYAIMTNSGLEIAIQGLGENGFDTASSINLSMVGAIITEVVLTFVFIFTILGVTSDEKKSPGCRNCYWINISTCTHYGNSINRNISKPCKKFSTCIIPRWTSSSTSLGIYHSTISRLSISSSSIQILI